MKILNLYSGLGGNRKNWTDVSVTAVECDQQIASIYQDIFPNDIVIVADAHEFLARNYNDYNFIWSSPPCQSHSKIRMMASKAGYYPAIMPDLTLYSEIIFLQHFASCKFVVENVKPYYQSLISPSQKLGRHYFWSNFEIPYKDFSDDLSHNERGMNKKGFFDLSEYNINHRKDQLIRNMVNPDIGEYILNLIK